MTRFFKNFTAAFAATTAVIVTVSAFHTIDQRHAEQRIELNRSLQEQAQDYAPEDFPTAEEVQAAHQPSEPQILPDPCLLESVLCEGEPGWEE